MRLFQNRNTGFYLDIGTQTTLWLVADLRDGVAIPLARGYWTNGFGLSAADSGRIPEEVYKAEALRILAKLNEVRSRHPIETTLAVGTAALRNAPNGHSFAFQLRRTTGIDFQILSSSQEAQMAWLGSHSRKDKSKSKILIDLGGGSTEVIWQNDLHLLVSKSLPFGASMLTKKCVTTDPPGVNAIRAITEFTNPTLDKRRFRLPAARTVMVAGGTATALGSMQLSLREYDPDQISSIQLSVPQVKKSMEALLAATESERLTMPGMPQDRVKVLPAGVVLLYLLMEKFGWAMCKPQDRGVLFGLPYFASKQDE